MKRILISIFVVFLFPCLADAATFYISSVSGDDTRTSSVAQAPETPWAHHPDDQRATGACAAYAPVNGDIFYFKRGEEWYGVDIRTTGGTQTISSTATFGSGAMPVLNGGWDTAGSFAADGGTTTYKSSVVTAAPNLVIYRKAGTDTKLTLGAAHDTLASNQYWWGDDGGTNYLFVNVGEDPDTGRMLASRTNWVFLVQTAGVAISNLVAEVSHSATLSTILANGSGNNATFGPGLTVRWSALHGIYTASVASTVINGATVYETGAAGSGIFYSELTGTNSVDGVSVYNVGLYGVHLSSNSTQTVGTNAACEISGITNYPIYVQKYGTRISNTSIHNTGTTQTAILIANVDSNDNMELDTLTISSCGSGIVAGSSVGGLNIHGNIFTDVLNAIDVQSTARISGCTVTGHDIGIKITAGASGGYVRDCTVHHSNRTQANCVGIQITNGTSVDVSRNDLHDNWNGLDYGAGGAGRGIALAGTATAMIVNGNLVDDNYIGILDSTTGNGANRISYNLVTNSIVNSIDLQATGVVAHDLIYNNFVLHWPRTDSEGVPADGTGHGIDLQIDAKKGKIFNNIVIIRSVAAGANGIFLSYEDANTDIYLDNNVVFAHPLAVGNPHLFTFSDFAGGEAGVNGDYDSVAAAITALTGTVKVKNSAGTASQGCASCLGDDPMVVSLVTPDYSLQSDSPCINAGINVGLTLDYTGKRIIGKSDMGAYEYGIPTSGGMLLSQ